VAANGAPLHPSAQQTRAGDPGRGPPQRRLSWPARVGARRPWGCSRTGPAP